MDYKSPLQSSVDQCIFRNVLIHMAGYNKSIRPDLEGHSRRVVGRFTHSVSHTAALGLRSLSSPVKLSFLQLLS